MEIENPTDLPTFRLPNARANEAYSQPLLPQTDSFIITDVIIPNALNLIYHKETRCIIGTPSLAGEYSLSILYHLSHQSSAETQQAFVKLIVNADPKTLWKNLPSDKNAQFWREDTCAEQIYSETFTLLAASKRGRAHAHVGSFRDDAYQMAEVIHTGWHIAVLADGAGSAKYSRRGAEIICSEARLFLQQKLEDAEGQAIENAASLFANCAASETTSDTEKQAQHAILQQALVVTLGYAARHAEQAIQNAVQHYDYLACASKDFASTALIVACKQFTFGTLCAAYWVGDGAIAVYQQQRKVTLLGMVDSGEYSGQTRFLDHAAVTDAALQTRTHFALVDDMTALLVMTDGISDAKFETDARLNRYQEWDALWQDLTQQVDLHAADAPQQLLAWLDFWSQGNHDDRTLALIYPKDSRNEEQHG